MAFSTMDMKKADLPKLRSVLTIVKATYEKDYVKDTYFIK